MLLLVGCVLGKWNYYSKTFNIIRILIVIILFLLYLIRLRLGCIGSLTRLYGPIFHVTPVDLCIIFQCNLYISCIMSCGNKLFQIVSSCTYCGLRQWWSELVNAAIQPAETATQPFSQASQPWPADFELQPIGCGRPPAAADNGVREGISNWLSVTPTLDRVGFDPTSVGCGPHFMVQMLAINHTGS